MAKKRGRPAKAARKAKPAGKKLSRKKPSKTKRAAAKRPK